MKASYSAQVYIDFSGNSGLPIALVGYPGETPLIGISTTSRAIFIMGSTHDWTIAKVRFLAASAAIHMGGSGFARIRLIGNEAGGIPYTYGTIRLKGCTNCKVLGNHLYDSGKAGSKPLFVPLIDEGECDD